MQAKYTLFTSDGIPIRAVCTVNLEEIDVTADPSQNPTSGSLSADRVHTMVTGDTLALVAYREYGDPELWRPLAAYNDIDDPMRMPDGAQLLLPTPDALLRPRSADRHGHHRTLSRRARRHDHCPTTSRHC